ncbi:CHAT domain-containing protein [Acidicapsa dinghuensis]|uniref:CHAT domain-containing protein n=1 Tax=Acidicapsa dinghuensis TaxID=2218256 RepID=A0ABW1EFP8_9BACT|nr:CHAT domain-containing protein [Acidicapsa dinghuensis]
MHTSSAARRVVILSILLMLLGSVIAYRWLRRRDSADLILDKADELAWNNQWMRAAPLYANAEALFRKQGRKSEALYAHVSQFIPRAENESLPDLLYELRKDEDLPEAQNQNTHLRILLIEGMIETNYDASMAKATWMQIEHAAALHGHYLLMARAWGEEGIAAFLLGDIATAKKLVSRAWLISKLLHDPAAHVRYASAFGAGLVEFHHYGEALKTLDEAIQTADSSSGVAYPSIAINAKIDALRGLHRYDDALALSSEALNRLPHASLDAHLFQILTARGQIFADQKRWSEAASEYDKALQYARHLNYWRGIAQTGGLLALAYMEEGQLTTALDVINEALAANAQLPRELYFAPGNLAIKARILDKLGRANESGMLYERSLALIDSLIATAPTPELEEDVLSELGIVYTGYFDSLARRGDLAGAFEAVEKARGRIEAEALEDHALQLPHVRTEHEERITQLDLQLLKADDPGVAGEVETALRSTEDVSDRPQLASRTATQPLSVKDVQHHLRPGELILEYVLSDPASWVLAINRTTVHKYDLAPKGVIEADASQYRKTILARKADPALAQELFNKLIAPIPEFRISESIIIVPDGALHLLPFSALVNRGSYILSDHNLSNSPSSTVLCLLREREAGTLKDSLQYVGVAASSDQSAKQSFVVRAADSAANEQLAPLPGSADEVEKVARDFPASKTLLLGADATETRFKRLPLSQYRVLHLALHGYADLQYPDRSALVFAPEKNGPDDGLLEVREIRQLPLDARLVTLSACNTGVGPIGAVDISNLTNAFIEAGSETVVAALWDLEDRSTGRLMTEFYGNLVDGQSKELALRNAQLTFVYDGLAPYYWAGFEIAGDTAGGL